MFRYTPLECEMRGSQSGTGCAKLGTAAAPGVSFEHSFHQNTSLLVIKNESAVRPLSVLLQLVVS